MEVGGWVQVLLGIFFLENHPKIALNHFISLEYLIYHVYSVCIYMYIVIKSC